MNTTMRCHICNSTKVIPLDTAFEVYACKACHHEFSALPPERQETYSPEYFREVHKRWFEQPNTALFQKINAAVEKVFPRKAAPFFFLDIGCGQGDLLRYMRNVGSAARLCGVDVIANADAGIRYYRGDFVTFPFSETFNAVSGLMVIEHIGTPHEFMRKISSVLKPGGLVIMNTINAGGLLYLLARFFRSIGIRGPFERLYDKHHLEHYNTASLRKLFELEGYRIREQRAHNFPLAAVDVPEGSRLLAALYRMGIACIFFLTSRFGGVHQTIICEKIR